MMMINKLAQFLPLLAVVVAFPTFAASNYHLAQRPHSDDPAADSFSPAGHRGRHLAGLQLTPDQKTKLQQLHGATKAKIDAVFTPEQRQKLAAIKAQRQANRPHQAAWNLTPDQKAKLKAIRQANREQMQAILTPEQQAQLRQDGKKHHGEHFGGGHLGRLDKLNLTAEQKSQLEQLRASARTQMDAVFTPEQRQQAKLRQEQRRSMVDQWKSLNLTADQKAQMEEIRRSSKAQFEAILTPEQRRQVQQHGRGGRWVHHQTLSYQ